MSVLYAQDTGTGRRGVLIGKSGTTAKSMPEVRETQKPRQSAKSRGADNAMENRLSLAGLPTSSDEILKWMSTGLDAAHSLKNDPALPREKAQLGVDAISLLGMRQYAAAVPALAEIAAGKIPSGIAQLIEMDMMSIVSDEREPYRIRTVHILSYNAVVSLGLIGDTRAVPVVMAAFRAEESPSAKVQYAMALASLDCLEGVDWIVSAIGSDDKKISTVAAHYFYVITGQDFGLTPVSSLARRKTLSSKYASWWKSNRDSFRFDQLMIMQRRKAPIGQNHIDDGTLRGRLRICSQYADSSSFSRSKKYREELYSAGTKLNGDLENIIMNRDEDVDIRMEALNTYYEINRSNSQSRAAMRKFLEKAATLRDNEVAEKARLLKLTLSADYKN